METIDIDERIFKHLIKIQDPRKNINIKHNLIDIIIIGICSVLCGCEHWEEIESFAKSKEHWFRKFLKLPNGIPSHDRIRAVFIFLDPKELEKSFRSSVQSVLGENSSPKIINIDGKTNKVSRDDSKGKKHST